MILLRAETAHAFIYKCFDLLLTGSETISPAHVFLYGVIFPSKCISYVTDILECKAHLSYSTVVKLD